MCLVISSIACEVPLRTAIHPPPTLSLREQGGLEVGDFLPYKVK